MPQFALAALLFAASSVLHAGTFEFRYTLEIRRGPELRSISPLSAFQAGDRLRILLAASQDSFCYLAVGRSDRYFQLTRAREVASELWSELPPREWILFDQKPGVEMIYLIVADRPVPEMEQLRSTGWFAETELLRVRARYQKGVRSERVTNRELTRIRQKSSENRPSVVMELIRLRHY